MRLRLPPIQAYPHSFDYIAPTGETDDWGKPEYTDSLTIEYSRFDEDYDFRRGGVNATNDMPGSLVSLFKKYNDNMPEFINQGIVTFKGREFTIISTIPLYFMSDEVIGYELEVK